MYFYSTCSGQQWNCSQHVCLVQPGLIEHVNEGDFGWEKSCFLGFLALPVVIPQISSIVVPITSENGHSLKKKKKARERSEKGGREACEIGIYRGKY